ncbi:hypothetical protein [Paenibacillus harenae]|uniref:DUF4367 domain-containing protein n=1 Tax=Paenibacillus harenae TaxID=306543 RepID=A0ABT9U3W4_PAEHA|nr:hypothetical protein [Paenibacillus harenae]MDQ0114331.1 hypothetical protein [Paenibacillus harenae]
MKAKLYVLIICCLFVNASTTYANQSPNNEREPFEKMFFESGHKSVDDAVLEFEKHFNRDIELPVMLPPVTFTHVFGQCHIDTDHKINDSLRIEYVSDNRIVAAPNHYVIDIRPATQKHKEIIRKRNVIRTYELDGGIKAIYGTMFNGRINALVFERSGWQYWLCVDKRIENKVPADTLFEIANSIGLETKYKEKLLK